MQFDASPNCCGFNHCYNYNRCSVYKHNSINQTQIIFVVAFHLNWIALNWIESNKCRWRVYCCPYPPHTYFCSVCTQYSFIAISLHFVFNRRCEMWETAKLVFTVLASLSGNSTHAPKTVRLLGMDPLQTPAICFKHFSPIFFSQK